MTRKRRAAPRDRIRTPMIHSRLPRFMTVPARNVYSPQRLKVVLALLTLVTLPVVVGVSLLIYQYMQFGVMVDRRLQGERWMVPSKVYARPLVLREGLPLPLRGFLKTLNAFKYEQRGDGRPRPRPVRGGREGGVVPSPAAARARPTSRSS